MKTGYIFILILIMLQASSQIHSQEKNIFLEAGGSGGLGSVNYERYFPPKIRNHTGWDGDDGVSPWRFSIRAGLGASPIDKNNGWVLVFPTMVNIIYGDNNKAHKIEAGAGFAPSVTTKGAFFIKSPLAFGYRFMPVDKKFFMRVTYTPIVAWLVDLQWQHWAGVSIGYRITK